MPVISLLTDFGNFDEYVGVMKGVILSINPDARIVDLNHWVAPQDIIQAAYLIKSSYTYFPKNTIHVVVVDPGVGTQRRIVALKIEDHFFVAPDNGVLSLLWQDSKIEYAVSVNNSRYFLPHVSNTFHGRDIIAPVAAWISKKVALKSLGSELTLSHLKSIEVPSAKISPQNRIKGTVISVDRFGNLLTNIEAKTIFQLCRHNTDKIPVVRLGNSFIKGLSSTYESVPEKSALMIIGSRNYLEVAVNCGDASRIFNVGKKDSIVVTLENGA